ncbi:hypothetical protein, partial [Pandoraea cepalis]|uniref:hypothetical protein n=1 Tax=Pandoraea cepalis TaxID=2508294 RepID=UPI0012424F3D
MTSTTLNAAESLRSPDTVAEPDPRTTMFVGQTPPSLAAHHREIEAIRLPIGVPEVVVIQFERGGFARSDSLLRFLSGTSEAIMLPI